MKIYIRIILTMILGIFISCNSTSKDNTNEISTANNNESLSDSHTSQNSLDWSGIYSGIEPCADCEGIKYIVTLKENGDYELITKYLTDTPLTNTKTGKFAWADGNTIRLDAFAEGEGSNFFKVEENQIRHLDIEGNKIEGALADYYILEKNGNFDVEDKKWQLTALFVKPIDSNPEDFYLIFDSKERKIHAKANCNSLNLSYTIENRTKLSVDNGISTKMACPDDTEDRLLKALRETDYFEVNSDELYLFQDKQFAPLAKFVLVKE